MRRMSGDASLNSVGSGHGRAGVACFIWGSIVNGWGALWTDREHSGWTEECYGWIGEHYGWIRALWMDVEHNG